MADSVMPQQQAHTSPASATNQHVGSGHAEPGAVVHIPSLLIRYRRLIMFAAGALMLAGFIALMLWSSEKPYRAVYTGMSEKDAAMVVDILQKEHIPYRLEAGGTVMVPADQVYQARLMLASQGAAPSGHIGFELFDQNNDFGLSEFTRKVNLQRALQGELAKTIEVIPQVSAAHVHLVLPKESAFAERDRKASASVMLQINGGRHLPSKTVEAIQNLVAASVPELQPEAVTVVDSSGALLSGRDKQAPSSESESMQEYRLRLERSIEQRITSMLEPVVGPGQVVVRVSAEIDRAFIEQHSTRYDPDQQVLRSQKSIQESHTSSAPNGLPLGVPGMASNTPGANPAVPPNGSAAANALVDQAQRRENVNNYEISTTQEHKVVPAGGIKKLSVAVIVGGTYQTGNNGERIFVPRSQQELADIRQLVQRAMGYDENREDALEVRSLPLIDISSRADREALESAEAKAFYLRLARYGIAAMILLLLALFVLRPLAKRIQGAEERAAAQPVESLPEAPAISAEMYQRLANMERVKQSIARDPERASRVLREWLDPA